MRLYDYWRSSAAYRVRLALNFKGLSYEQIAIDLRKGAQREPAFLALNPQGLVPVLEDDGAILTQSLPILNYLEERYPEPALLPRDSAGRARSRAIAVAIACEIHPLNNLRVLQYLERELGLDEGRRMAWYRHWIAEGFGPLERMIARSAGEFCVGDFPSLADLCLVPQVYNARRHQCDLEAYPIIRQIDERCREIEAFARAAPERQPDAPPN
ncbi:MAG TPA: maleylacetoacetate isomerase [Geminicoccaceae bacterium]|jgi:maleylacetoacetate isomerase|nr:maleylacetoacetate isomerase [Geminicoccaceae bacterium]